MKQEMIARIEGQENVVKILERKVNKLKKESKNSSTLSEKLRLLQLYREAVSEKARALRELTKLQWNYEDSLTA